MNRENPQSIGVILVHGIGEQRRFEHLDGQTRFLLKALRDYPGVTDVSVDIRPSGAATFQAEQDTWTAGPNPPVSVLVTWHEAGAVRRTRICVHEVWWADVNETYSIAKQFRFWLWGLAIWSHPGKPGSTRPIAQRHWTPMIPGQSIAYDRFRLYLTSTFFALLGLSIGPIGFVVNRLFKMKAPDVLRVVTNYLSSVKLYVQQRRFGPGLWWAREEFLDSIQEPPRVSIRRRMVRAMADVACAGYDRWYVLAHSQGTVVAFNGLMADSYAWPGYLDEERWTTLKAKKLAGPSILGISPPLPPIQPPTPGWATAPEIVYRSRILRNFRGFLSYGSPLEKFAGVWPELVPVSREPVFSGHPPWINLYDKLDPVSGRLLAFAAYPPACCPAPQNVGYNASWWLLLAHLKYMTHRKGKLDAATATVRWVLTDSAAGFAGPSGWGSGNWFTEGTLRAQVRGHVAWLTWFIAGALLAFLAAIVLPLLRHSVQAASSGVWNTTSNVIWGH